MALQTGPSTNRFAASLGTQLDPAKNATAASDTAGIETAVGAEATATPTAKPQAANTGNAQCILAPVDVTGADPLLLVAAISEVAIIGVKTVLMFPGRLEA